MNGIFEFDQAKALKNYGHKVIYLSLDLRSIRRKRKLGKYWSEVDNIDILNISIPLGKIPSGLRYKIGKLGLRLYYKEILKRHGKPDIIHAHFYGIGLMSSVLKEKFKIPLVITEHSSHINKQHLNFKLKNRTLKAYKNANRLITVSSALKKIVFKHFYIESDIVHNIVDTKEFNYIENEKTNFVTFLSVGTLNYNKGFDILIEAFKKANFNKNTMLKIIGKGPEREKLQRQIDEAGLNEQIKLLGFLNRTEISKIMNECDAFVLASRGETFGVVYIEAMVAGLPVIATACGGPEDFVNEQNGLLIPPNDVEELSNALTIMSQKSLKFDRKSISENSKNKFSPKIIAEQLTQVYTELLINRK